MSRQTITAILRIIAFIFFALALSTVVPWSAVMISDLGYYTLCPFAPWSTLALAFFGGLAWVVRSHMNRQQA